MNYYGGNSADVATDSAGLVAVPAAAWNNFTRNAMQTSVVMWNGTATETPANLTQYATANSNYWYTPSGIESILRTYLDDNASNHAKVTFTCIPFKCYDIYVYKNHDGSTACAYSPVSTIIGSTTTSYTCGDDGIGVVGTSTWGGRVTTSTLGKSVICIKAQTAPVITIDGGTRVNNKNRGTIAAIQIVENTSVTVPEYTATVSGSVDFKDLKWTPEKPAGGFAATDTLIINNTADDATLTIDEDVTANILTVTSEAGKNLTIAKGDVTAAFSFYNFIGAVGKATVGFDTGAATVISGKDTVLAGVANPALTIASGNTLTVKSGTLSEANVSDKGTLNFDGGTAANPIIYDTTAAATDPGTMTLAAGAYLRIKTYNCKKGFAITGASAASSTVQIYTAVSSGQGMPSNAQFRNVTLVVTGFTGNNYLWLENSSTLLDATVNVVADSNTRFNKSYTIGSLSGAGVTYGSATTITPSEDATYSGSSSEAFTIAASGFTQTFSGNYTGALTVNSGATAKLTGSATPSAVTDNGTVALGGDAAYSYAKVISGSGAVVKEDDNTATLSGANTYTGGTTVKAGTLKVTGAIGTGNYTVNEGATIELPVTRPSGKLVGTSKGTVRVTISDEEKATLENGDTVETISIEGDTFAGTLEACDTTGAAYEIGDPTYSEGKIVIAKKVGARMSPYFTTNPAEGDWTAASWTDSSSPALDVRADQDWENKVSAKITVEDGTTTALTADRAIQLGTLTVDNAGTLAVSSSGENTITADAIVLNNTGALTLSGDAITADAIDDTASTGATTIGFDTGAATVAAGADTVLTAQGTGTLTIDANKKATVPAWDKANVSGTGTIDISAATAETAVTWGETANFTGTMRLLQGTWAVTAGSNGSGYPRKSAVEVVGPNAVLKFTTTVDATGYNGDLSKSLTVKDGGTLRVEKRDTFSRTLNLDNGNVVFDQDASDSSRAFDLHGSAAIHVTGTGKSTFGGTTAGSIENSGIISLRNTPTITVDTSAQFDVYSQWGGKDGYNAWTKAGAGKIVFYRPAQSSMTSKATVSGGTVQFANGGQGTLGEIALASGTKLELNATASDGSYTAANTVTGAGRVFKVGAGTYTLTGANTYSGGTTVEAGTLKVTGSIGTGDYTVKAGATLDLGTVRPTGALVGTSAGTVKITISDADKTTLENGGTVATIGISGDAFAGTLKVYDSKSAEYEISGLTYSEGKIVIRKKVPTARWTNAQGDGDTANAANWNCTDAEGKAVSGVVPGEDAFVYFEGAGINAQIPNATTWGKVIFNGSLGADCDWRGLSAANFAANSVIDLKGKNLSLAKLGEGTGAMTVTNSVEGAEGVADLVFDIGANQTNENTTVKIAGNVRFVKEGEGTYCGNVKSQTYTGGTVVSNGTIKAVQYEKYYCLGKEGSDIRVAPNGVLELNTQYDWGGHTIYLDGGTLSNVGGNMTQTGWGGLGNITLTADSTLQARYHTLFNQSSNNTVELGGHTLNIVHIENPSDDKAIMYFKQTKIQNGTIVIGQKIVAYPMQAGNFGENVTIVNNGDFRFSGVDQTVLNFTDASMGYEQTRGKTMSVTGRYTPKSTYLVNAKLMNGATLDLTEQTGPWTFQNTLGTQTLSYEEDATITVDVNGRTLAKGDQVVGWSAKPEDITFQWDATTAASGAEIAVDEFGIFYDGGYRYTVDINNGGTFTIPNEVADADLGSVRLFYAGGKAVSNPVRTGRTITFDWEITGGTCWWDYEFDGNGNNTGTEGTALSWDYYRSYKGNEFTEDGELRIPSSPWRDVSSWPETATFVLYGTMVGTDKTYQLAFGSTYKGTEPYYTLFLATDSVKDNTVNLCLATAKNAPTVLCTMTVPNAQSAKHLYAFTLKTVDAKTVIDIYLDGELLQEYPFDTQVVLGAGFQIGSGHGGCCSGYNQSSSTDTAVQDFLRVYDTELSQATLEKYAVEYPYVSPNGSYQRTVKDGDVWSATEAWTKEGTTEPVEKADVPVTNSTVKLTVDGTTTLGVNLAEDISYESIIINGGDLTLAQDAGETEGKVISAGRVLANANVTFNYDAFTMLNAPITVKAGKTVTFDLSMVDMTKFFTTQTYDLTGYATLETGATITFTPPAQLYGRTISAAIDPTTKHYVLTVSVPDLPFTYTIAEGGEGTWTWGEQTVDEATVLAQSAATIKKAGNGTQQFPGLSKYNYIVDEGTLMFTNVVDMVSSTVTVNGNGTFDMNGKPDAAYNIVLNGGALVNNGDTIGNNVRQFDTLTLTADSMIGGTGNFAFIRNHYAAGTVDLGGWTLTKTGSNTFTLDNDTVTNGTVAVNAGTLQMGNTGNVTFTDATLAIGAEGTVGITSSRTLIVAEITGTEGATIANAGTLAATTLKGTIALTGNGSFGTLTLADAATVDIGEKRDLTFAGAGTVNVVLTDAETKAQGVQTLFTAEAGATTAVGTVTDADGNAIPFDAGTAGKIYVIHVAEIGETGYCTLAAAIDAAEAGQTVKLLRDVTLDDCLLIEKQVTLDLNGKTVAYDKTKTMLKTGVIAVRRGGDLTVTDSVGTGAIDGENMYAAVMMTRSNDLDKIDPDTYGEDNKAKLTVAGGTLKGYYYGIGGNGNAGRGNTEVTVSGGMVKGLRENDSTGIYNPQYGTLTVSGGTVEGAVGIYVKAGTVTTTVSGGTVRGTGAKGAYVTTSDGFDSTGDALVIDNAAYPGGEPGADIQGGTFESSNNQAVASYAKVGYERVTGFVTGGSFYSPVAMADDLLNGARVFVADTEKGEGWYKVEDAAAKIGDVYYITLAAANAAAEDGDTITLLADASGAGIFVETDNLTFDFGGFTYTVTGPAVGSTGTQSQGFHIEAANCTLTGGTLTSVSGSGVKMLVQNYSNLSLVGMTLDGTQIDKAYANGDYVLSNNAGSTVIENTTITAKEGDFAFDTCKFGKYAAPTVEVTGTSVINGNVELSGGNLTLTAGTLNGTLKDGGIGSGTVTKSADFEAAAPTGYTWKDGTLTKCAAKIGTTYYLTLKEAIEAVPDKGLVELCCNASGDGIIITADKNFALDLGGYTYTVAGNPVGSKGTETLGFQILAGAVVDIKNGTITSAQGSGVKMLIQNYATLVINGATLDGRNLDGEGKVYTLSNNNGFTEIIAFGEVIARGEGDIAMDACTFGAYDGTEVRLDGGKITGDIEVSWYAGKKPTHTVELDLVAGIVTGKIVMDPTAENANVAVVNSGSVEVAIPAGYKWNDQGVLTKCAAKIGDVYYITLADAVEAYDGTADIVLVADTTGAAIGTYLNPKAGQIAAKDIVIDFGGFTYTVDGPLAGSTGTETQAFHFEGGDVVLKNGTITSSTAKMLIQNYTDLTLTDLVVDGSDLLASNMQYVFSNNQGDVNLTGTTKVIGKDGFVAMDACKYGTYTAPVVTLADTVEIEGDVELSGGTLVPNNATITGTIKYYAGAYAYIGTTAYSTLAAANAAAQDGDTIKLMGNMSGDGIFVTVDNLTFDFGGKTYTVTKNAVGSTGTTTQGFHIEAANCTLQNGTLTSTDAATSNVKMLVQNYSNLTLADITLDGTNIGSGRYTLSNNNGATTIGTGVVINAPTNGFAFDVCRYKNNPSVSVTVDGATINGNIEVSASDGDVRDGCTLTLETGTVTGNLVMDASAANAVVKKISTFTLNTPEGYEWKGDGSTNYETLTKKSDTPTVKEDEGAITPVAGKENTYAVSNTTDTVTIENLPANSTVIVDPSVTHISGMAENTTVKIVAESTNTTETVVDITDAFTVTPGTGTSATIALNPEGTVTIESTSETIKVTPELTDADEEVKPLVVTDDNVDIGVKTIPGLKYQIIKSATPTFAQKENVGEPITAKGTRLALEAAKGSDPAAFYKVEVTK